MKLKPDIDFSKRLKARRKELKLTQQEVAEEARISASYLGYIERKGCRVSTIVLNSLADALGVKITWLSNGEPPKLANSPALILTKRHQELIELWNMLSNENQKAVLNLIQVMNKND